MINRAENVEAAALLSYMPKWMVEKVAECPPHQILISYDSESDFFVMSRSDTDGEERFDDMPAAHKEASALDTSKYELLFSRSILDNPRVSSFDSSSDQNLLNSVFWKQSLDPNASSFMLNARSWAAGILSIEEDLDAAHAREGEWKNNMKDVVLSHELVRNHPAVWQHYVHSDPLKGYWETSAQEAYSIDVWSGEETGYPSQVVIHLEGHIRNEDPRSQRSSRFAFNPDLIADAATFEEAIVYLAARLNAYYDCCGTERALAHSNLASKPCKWSTRPQRANQDDR